MCYCCYFLRRVRDLYIFFGNFFLFDLYVFSYSQDMLTGIRRSFETYPLFQLNVWNLRGVGLNHM